MVSTEAVISGALSVSLLVFLAKVLAGVFSKLALPAVLGELFAGIIFGPYALGQYAVAFGHPIIQVDEIVLVFAEIGAVLILFTAGLEMTFAEFRRVGLQSFIIGALGVAFPFFTGFYFVLFMGGSWAEALLIGSALTATSIAVTVKVFEELGKLNSTEAKVVINAAVVDDVLGLAVLAVVVSVIQRGVVPGALEIAVQLAKILVLWLGLLVGLVYSVPRLLRLIPRWRAEGTVEAASTAVCFGSASMAFVAGLSPIVGSYAAGMALAGSGAIEKVKEYIEKVNMIFSPIFFAVIGAQLNLRSLDAQALALLAGLVAIAIVSKLFGCGVPAALMLRSRRLGERVGWGMTSRGEVGLVIAGIGLTSGLISQPMYAASVAMIVITTIFSPIFLRSSYKV